MSRPDIEEIRKRLDVLDVFAAEVLDNRASGVPIPPPDNPEQVADDVAQLAADLRDLLSYIEELERKVNAEHEWHDDAERRSSAWYRKYERAAERLLDKTHKEPRD